MAKKNETQKTNDDGVAVAHEDDGGAQGAADQVQATIDQENEQGFRGVKVDPTPNEAYTLSGVVEGQPTPETNEDAYNEAQSRVRGTPFSG